MLNQMYTSDRKLINQLNYLLLRNGNFKFNHKLDQL